MRIAVAAVSVVAAALPAAPPPAAVAAAEAAAPGSFVSVSGHGWTGAAGDVVLLTMCGNEGHDGSADCDNSGTASAGVRADGTFAASLRVVTPPRPCPCVIRVAARAGGGEVDLPFTVVGAPIVAPTSGSGPRRSVRVDQVRLVRDGGWLSALGITPRWSIRYRVTNTGDVALHHPAVDVSWGRSSDATGYVAPPDLGDLAPGASTSVRSLVPVSAVTVGSVHARVRVDPLGTVSTATVAAMVVPPWIVLAAGAFVASSGALVARRRRAPLSVAVPASTVAPLAAPGWYPDPLDADRLRLWDGARWTEVARAWPRVGAPREVVAGGASLLDDIVAARRRGTVSAGR